MQSIYLYFSIKKEIYVAIPWLTLQLLKYSIPICHFVLSCQNCECKLCIRTGPAPRLVFYLSLSNEGRHIYVTFSFIDWDLAYPWTENRPNLILLKNSIVFSGFTDCVPLPYICALQLESRICLNRSWQFSKIQKIAFINALYICLLYGDIWANHNSLMLFVSACTSWGQCEGPFYWHGLTVIPALIGYYIHYDMWVEIIYLFSNYNDYTGEVWEWISNFIPQFTMHVITYPWWDQS